MSIARPILRNFRPIYSANNPISTGRTYGRTNLHLKSDTPHALSPANNPIGVSLLVGQG
ncbi:hypothetical protein [Alloprevotella tannerae]|uniref:hypothetical protein n=1 Tax=Alloprevotella tannerae TaxID=76122 RepID=UPI0028E57446|nr:hypothetical protein [Alloprevotella tannerae]